MASGNNWSLTQHLYNLNADNYRAATQSAGLQQAAHGKLSKAALSQWLANDRLYIHAYIKAAAGLIHTLDLPKAPSSSNGPKPVEVKLLDWLIEGLANVRREEQFFFEVAERYGFDINLADADGKVLENAKSEGLKRFEALFGALPPASGSSIIPWLEGVVVFWGTERVYLDAWTWAKSQISESGSSTEGDADGGALRKEFIPNWTSAEFAAFVNDLGSILDQGVNEALAKQPNREGVEALKKEIALRAETKWAELLKAETAFWPQVA